jgi:two-component system chemotaxis sensor kinase CheA
LIIEDEMDIREAMRLVLETFRASVVTAVEGLEGLDRLSTPRLDAILCDLRMPRMDGFVFVRRLRQTPSRLHLPVLAVSAQVTAADGDRTRGAGFNDQLKSKPSQD